MAITAARSTTDFDGFLPADISAPIFERAARTSVVQQLVQQVPLSINGNKIPVVTGRPTANWVGEGGRKPATQGALTLKTISPEKLAAIAVVSAEVVRANPGGYMTTLRPQLAEAFAIAFDLAAFYNIGGDGTGTGPFSTYIAQTTKTREIGTASQSTGGLHKDFAEALEEVIIDTDASGRRYRFTGWAIDDLLEPLMFGQVDTTGRPLWVDLPANDQSVGLARQGSLLGRPSFMGEVANPLTTTLGFGGDWSQARWGVLGGISYRVSTEATVTINGTLTSLFEHNLVAILAEAEYGFLVNDVDAFVELTQNAS